MPIRPVIGIKFNIIWDFLEDLLLLSTEMESGKYEIYMDYSNISPLAGVRAAVIDGCRRAPDLRGVALCGRRGAH